LKKFKCVCYVSMSKTKLYEKCQVVKRYMYCRKLSWWTDIVSNLHNMSRWQLIVRHFVTSWVIYHMSFYNLAFYDSFFRETNAVPKWLNAFVMVSVKMQNLITSIYITKICLKCAYVLKNLNSWSCWTDCKILMQPP
jgi:hypothetical protein